MGEDDEFFVKTNEAIHGLAPSNNIKWATGISNRRVGRKEARFSLAGIFEWY